MGSTWLVAVTAAAAVVLPAPVAGAGQPGAVRLTTVAVAAEGTMVRVSLRATGPLPPVTVERTTDGPPRLFVDLPGVVPGDVPARLPGAGPVRRVRTALNAVDPPVTRVVFDLAGEVSVGLVPAGAATGDVTIAIAAGPLSAREERASARPVPAAARPAPTTAAGPSVATAPVPPRPVATTPLPVVVAAPAGAIAGPAASPSPPPAAPQSTPPAPRPAAGFSVGRAPRPTGRVAVFASGARATAPGSDATAYADVMTAVSFSFLDRDTDGVEYGLDLRYSAYTIEGRDPRVSIYNGFVGRRLAAGHASLRAGHLWLDDLGGLGALAGVQLEARSGPIPDSGAGRWRGGVFGGLDPNVYTFGYGDGVRKLGGYAVLEGARGRRHVAGYVNVHNGEMTERSVLSVANFVPAGPLFVYQVAEYDLAPVAGGRGHDGLTYLFGTARLSVGPRLELQGTVSRGRSVDARGLSDDIRAGRAVTQQAVDGLRYESYGGRVSGEILPRVRAYVGYSRDRNNRTDVPTGRWQSGGFAGDLFGSGVDLTVSASRLRGPTGSYHSTFVSVGRELGRRVYATAEMSTALSLVRFLRGDGIVVETRPTTRRLGGNATVQLWRATSSFVSLEHTRDGDDYREWRGLTGLTVRIR
ncbi:MAG: AMIN domain-containing protein [Vicinamibacterales bacterium]